MKILEKIFVYIQNIGRKIEDNFPCDKRMHFIIGVIITSFSTSLLYLLNIKNSYNVISTFIILNIIGYGIEYFQRKTKSGNYEIKDYLSVVLGGSVSLIPIIVIFIF